MHACTHKLHTHRHRKRHSCTIPHIPQSHNVTSSNYSSIIAIKWCRMISLDTLSLLQAFTISNTTLETFSVLWNASELIALGIVVYTSHCNSIGSHYCDIMHLYTIKTDWLCYHAQGFKNENTLRHSSLFLLTACPCSKMIFCFAVMFFLLTILDMMS